MIAKYWIAIAILVTATDALCISKYDTHANCINSPHMSYDPTQYHPKPLPAYVPKPQTNTFVPKFPVKNDVGIFGKSFANRINPPRLANAIRNPFDFENARVYRIEKFVR